MERNLTVTDCKTEVYLEEKIVAWVNRWEKFNCQKQKWENKKEVVCNLYKKKGGGEWQPLNLGECNNGSKFTAVNQAKDFINCCNENSY